MIENNTLSGLKIGFGITGSFCTISKILPVIEALVSDGADVLPIISKTVAETDTRFGKADDLKRMLEGITGKKPLREITEVEPIGPKGLIDVMVAAPCTGSSIAKIANGISDTPVTLAVKSHLRNNRPVVIAVSTNDGLSGNIRNIGTLLTRKNIYIVPFGQDDSASKENSLVSDFSLIGPTITSALSGAQLQPLLI